MIPKREHEWKSYPLLAFKAAPTAAGDTKGEFSGYASTWTKDVYGDVIQPGAFAQSIADQKGKVPLFYNHDDSLDNTLGAAIGLAEDAKGLLMNGQLALDTSAGKNAYALLKLYDSLDYRMGLSIGFIATDIDMDESNNTRRINTIELWEISITPFPANKRAFVDDVKSIRDIEKRLRDVGRISGQESKRIVASLTALLTAGAVSSPLAPKRDVREVQTQPTPAPPEIMETIWQTLQRP